ncbi:MAG: 2-phospho-L-lactate transferase CofD family protein, partial [Solirubrobacterales bacterium]
DVEAIALARRAQAPPSPEVLEAIASADLLVIGPSNPVISIGPILALPGVREALVEATAPVVAVSPYVAGKVVKGPTDNTMRALGRSTDSRGVWSLYEGIPDVFVCDRDDPDPPSDSVRCFSTPTLMDSARRRQALARAVIEVGRSVEEG